MSNLQIEDAIEKRMRFISENREHFIEAFLAETGYLPSEVVMIQQEKDGVLRIWFEKKAKSEDLYRKSAAEDKT